MRAELKNYDWHTYGLDHENLDYIYNLIIDIIDRRNKQLKLIKIITKIRYIFNPIAYEETSSDLAHYNYVENQFLLEFGFLRIQGIFEGILKKQFFPEDTLFGLTQKIERAIKEGGNISVEEKELLLEWSNFRNKLTHNPPEKYRPSNIIKDDLEEFKNLCRNIILRLTNY